MSPSLLDHANPSKHISRAECPQKPTTVGRGTHPLARDHKHEAPDSQGLSDSSGGRTRTHHPPGIISRPAAPRPRIQGGGAGRAPPPARRPPPQPPPPPPAAPH